MPLHIAILYGSVREARAGIRVVRFLDAALRRRGHQVSVVDPLEYRLPLLDRMYKEYERGSAPAIMERLAELYRQADAFAIVSGSDSAARPDANASPRRPPSSAARQASSAARSATRNEMWSRPVRLSANFSPWLAL